MTLRQLSVSGRSLSIAAVLIGMVSLAIGAPAALNKRSLDTAKAAEAAQIGPANKASRLALVIGNGHYPDANAPLAQPINDARAMTAALRREGFDVVAFERRSAFDDPSSTPRGAIPMSAASAASRTASPRSMRRITR